MPIQVPATNLPRQSLHTAESINTARGYTGGKGGGGVVRGTIIMNSLMSL